jgi:hypothetical protein
VCDRQAGQQAQPTGHQPHIAKLFLQLPVLLVGKRLRYKMQRNACIACNAWTVPPVSPPDCQHKQASVQWGYLGSGAAGNSKECSGWADRLGCATLLPV